MSQRSNMGRRSALKSLKRKDTVGIIFLGDEKVGKSAIIRRWINNEFTSTYQATVENFFMKTVVSLNQRVNTTIVDIAGSRQFPSMDDLYISKSDIVILAYEIGNEKSIKSLKRYYESAREALNGKRVTYALIGTKHDEHESDTMIHDEIAHECFTDLEKQPVQFLTSAKTGHNISELFEHVIKETIGRSLPLGKQLEKTFSAESQQISKEKSCCTLL